MEIKKLIRKNRTIQEDDSHTFYSFEEVFDYCYEHLRVYPPLFDSVLFRFKILDTNEQFDIVGGTTKNETTKETYIYTDIRFDVEIKQEEYL